MKKSSFFKIIASIAILGGTSCSIFAQRPAFATEVICNTGLSVYDIGQIGPEGCVTTPSFYRTKIYQIGLCTSNPLAANPNSVDTSSCKLVVDTSDGQTAVLAQDGTVKSEPLSRGTGESNVPAGTYPYAYFLINSTIDTQSHFTFYTDTSANSHTVQKLFRTVSTTGAENTFIGDKMLVDQTSDHLRSETDDLLIDQGNASCDGTGIAVPGGTLQARLLDVSLQKITAVSRTNTIDNVQEYYCPGAQRIAGAIALSSPLVSTNGFTNIDVGFLVTNKALFITNYNNELYAGFNYFGIQFSAN